MAFLHSGIRKKIVFLFFIFALQTISTAQETVVLSDFSLVKKKKKSILSYRNQEIKELDNTQLDIFNVFKNYLILYVYRGQAADHDFYLIDTKGNFLFDKPFKNADFALGLTNIITIMTFPDYSYAIDTNFQEIPNTRCTKITRSSYNNEADLTVVWQKYGIKSQLFVYDMELKLADGKTKFGLFDLKTGMIIAPPIHDHIRYYGFLENGVFVGEKDKKEALYDFKGNRLSDFYDGIYSNNGYCRIENNKLNGVMDYSGKELVKPTYKNIYDFKGAKHFLCTTADNKVGIIDALGKVIMPFEFSYTNFQITDYPLSRYIPVTKNLKLYGYFDIKNQQMVTDFIYDLAGPEVNNVANVREINGNSRFISFDDYSTGALLKTVEQTSQIKNLASFISEQNKYILEKYQNAAQNYKTREEALEYFYPYYREFCIERLPKINNRIALYKKEFGHLLTYEEVKIIEQITDENQKLKKKLDEKIEKSGGKIIHLIE